MGTEGVLGPALDAGWEEMLFGPWRPFLYKQFGKMSGWSSDAHYHLEPEGLILNPPEKDR